MNGSFGRLAIITACALLGAACGRSRDQQAEQFSAVVQRYCLDCHDAAGEEAGLSLEHADLKDIGPHAEVWEKVVRKLRGRMMPPPGVPRPDEATYDGVRRVAREARSTRPRATHRIPAARRPPPAEPLRVRATPIRDLLALDVDAAELLPADDEANGFDNIADVLRCRRRCSSSTSRRRAKVSALAVGDPTRTPISAVYRVPPDLAQDEHIEGLPLGTRGGISSTTTSRSTATTSSTSVLLHNIVGYMTGLEWPHELEIAIDGERVFLADRRRRGRQRAVGHEHVGRTANAIDERLRTRVPVKAGPHDVGVTFLAKSAAESDEPLQPFTRNLDLQDMNGLPLLDYVQITGPFDATGSGDTPSRRADLRVPPAERGRRAGVRDRRSCRRSRAARIAARSTRARIVALLLGSTATAASAARSTPASRARCARPREPEVPVPRRARSGRRRAGHAVSRSTISSSRRGCRSSSGAACPTTSCSTSRRRASCTRTGVLERQVRRMLADPRPNALVDNFAGQWLFLRNLQSVASGRRASSRTSTTTCAGDAPRDGAALREHHARGPHVVDLLTADYTFVNERLAQHYGIPDIYGSQFREVALDRSEPPRPARPGQRPHGHVAAEPHVAGAARQVGAREHPRHAAAAAAAERAAVPRERGRQGAALRARAARGASHESPRARRATRSWTRSASRSRTSTRSARWRTREPGGAVDASGQLADGTRDRRPGLAARGR